MRGLLQRVESALLPADVRAVRRAGLTYLSPRKLRRLDRAVHDLDREGVAGDFVEFGVALGGAAIVLSRRLGPNRHFHGFDVFAMIPPPTSANDDEKSRARYDLIKSGRATGLRGTAYYGYRENLYDEVKDSFARWRCNVDGTRIALHRGLFEDTWPAAAPAIERVAFAHIDCDWYDPVKYCLEAIADRVSPGGVIVIDDYNDYGGARTAVNEFRARRSDFTFEAGANPILRKKARC